MYSFSSWPLLTGAAATAAAATAWACCQASPSSRSSSTSPTVGITQEYPAYLDEWEQAGKSSSSSVRVVVPRPAEFERKRRALRAGGWRALKILSDFDRTMTRCYRHPKSSKASSSGEEDARQSARKHDQMQATQRLCEEGESVEDGDDWEPVSTSHGVVEQSEIFSPEMRQQALAYKEKYYPLEISMDITDEERLGFMEKWWGDMHELLVEHGMSRRELQDCVAGSNLLLRKGVVSVLRRCRQQGVPFLVFTAGLADVIREFLGQLGVMHEDLYIAGNWMVWEDEQLVRFEKEVVHSLNKKFSSVVQGAPFAARSADRVNVLLLGDNLHDVSMADGCPYENIIRVGFNNARPDRSVVANNAQATTEQELRRSKLYEEKFDVVVCGDGDFDVVNWLLDGIDTE